MQSFRFIVSGRVQGVYYRSYVQEAASAEGFSGYVKNLPDGRVEACVTLEPRRYEVFYAILETGSPASVVEDIISEEIDERFEGMFKVRY